MTDILLSIFLYECIFRYALKRTVISFEFLKFRYILRHPVQCPGRFSIVAPDIGLDRVLRLKEGTEVDDTVTRNSNSKRNMKIDFAISISHQPRHAQFYRAPVWGGI
jgi:hypothetical protein